MKISATLITPDLAMVHMEPSLIERLLGKQEQEVFVCRFPDINGGFVWLLDAPPNRPVSRDVLYEIERAEVAAEWCRVWARLERNKQLNRSAEP